MKRHASSILGPTLTPRRLSSTLGFFKLFFIEKRQEGVGGHQCNRDVEAARGVFIFVFVFSQGSPKYIEFLAWSQLLKLFFFLVFHSSLTFFTLPLFQGG